MFIDYGRMISHPRKVLRVARIAKNITLLRSNAFAFNLLKSDDTPLANVRVTS